MNKFDLNAYGVSEMNKKEMVEINGGWKLIGKNYLFREDCGLYIRTFLFIPYAVGYQTC